jgi:hypothetical protein
MKKASEYRAHAEDCRRLAMQMKLEPERAALVQMAADWEEMAVYRARLIVLHPEIAQLGEHEEEGLDPPPT